MSDRIQRPLAWLIAVLMVTAVAAAPTVAQVYDPEAERVFDLAANSDTVDGFHAIGATGNKTLRARKLVATNRYGQLPSNIIRPRWRELKGVPAGFKDGVDDVGPTYKNRFVYDSSVSDGVLPPGESRRIHVKQIPRGAGVHFGLYALQTNHTMRIDDVEVWWDNDGTHHYIVVARNISPWPVQFKVRATVFA